MPPSYPPHKPSWAHAEQVAGVGWGSWFVPGKFPKYIYIYIYFYIEGQANVQVAQVGGTHSDEPMREHEGDVRGA